MAEPSLSPSRFSAGYSVGGRTGSEVLPPATGPASAATSAPVNQFAVIGFVLILILGPFAVPVGVPIALVGQRQIARTGQSGAGLARAALYIGAVYGVIGVVVVLLAVAGIGR